MSRWKMSLKLIKICKTRNGRTNQEFEDTVKENKINETQIDGLSLCKHQRNYLVEESAESYLKTVIDLR